MMSMRLHSRCSTLLTDTTAEMPRYVKRNVSLMSAKDLKACFVVRRAVGDILYPDTTPHEGRCEREAQGGRASQLIGPIGEM